MLALLGSPAPAVPEPPVEAIVTRHQEIRELFDCFLFLFCLPEERNVFEKCLATLGGFILGKSSEVVIAVKLFAKLQALIWNISHNYLDCLEFIAQFISSKIIRKVILF